MPTLESMDTKSYVSVQWGGSGSYIAMPALPGTSAVNDPGLQKVFLAGNASFEAQNWMRGLSQPVVDLLTIPHKSWFTAANLQALLVNRNSGTGYLDSIGHVNYRIGSSHSSDEVKGAFTQCFASTFMLSGGGRGTPLSCRIGLLPAGFSEAGTPPAAIAAGSTGYFMSDGVTFGADPGLTDILSWQLVVMNNPSPDTAVAGAGTVPLASDTIYPSQYLSGPIGVMLTIVQKSNATVVLDGVDNTDTYTFSLTLKSVEATVPEQTTVNLQFEGMRPAQNSAINMGLTTVARTYVGIKAATTSSLVIG